MSIPPETRAAGDAETALVVFTPSGRRGRFPIGTTVLDAARALGVYVESVCGGRGLCGRCQVVPGFGAFAKHAIAADASHLSARNEVEERYSARRTLPADRRLSCQARIFGDLVVDVPTDTAVTGPIVRKRSEARAIERDCATRLHYVEIGPPEMAKPIGDLDRISRELRERHGLEIAGYDLHVLAEAQPALAQGGYAATVAVHADNGAAVVTAIWPGYRERLFGIACDIGSTTIACHLVDLASGRVVASAGTTNPQIRFGEDLMSRVSYAMLNPGGLAAMTTAVRDALRTLAARVAAQGGAGMDEVLEAVIVANPVMHHIFLGIDPAPLGQAPFALARSAAITMRAAELGLGLATGARLYILPCVAGHVGADAAAVALAEAPRAAGEVVLVVDIGTNAEILLGDGERLLAASSPTGPAFEGAQISCGQRAAPGAIERVRIDRETLEPRIRIIGSDLWSDEPGFAEAAATLGVTGICGSGIVEAVAELFLAGVIRADGSIDGTLAARSARIVADGRTFSYVLWREPVELRITQGDVRAIQLAKGALYAGTRLLMEHLGVERVDRIKLAGAFGSHIDPKFAMVIGLVPDCRLPKVSAVGNAAGTGACMALLNRGHRREVEAMVVRMEKIETALEPRFQKHFVDAMAFPNGRDVFVELAREVALPSPQPATTRGRRNGSRRSQAT